MPWATFGDGPLPFEEPDTPPFGPGLQPMRGPVGRLRNRLVRAVARRFIFADADRVYRQRAVGPGPAGGRNGFVLDEMSSPYLHLQGSTPGFEYPHAVAARSTCTGSVRCVRTCRRTGPPPAWWPEVTGSRRPVVVVSQGSIRPDSDELLVPTIAGLADADVLVVVTTGHGRSGSAGRPRSVGSCRRTCGSPSSSRTTSLLQHADVFVTNGGYTGVTLALAHGVPLVQAGTTEEKAEIAARIEYTGVGVRLGTTTAHPGRGSRRRAPRCWPIPSYVPPPPSSAAEMAAHDAGREGAELLERLATTARPVLRSDLRREARPRALRPSLTTAGTRAAPVPRAGRGRCG